MFMEGTKEPALHALGLRLPLKYVSLVALVAQNSAIVLLMKQSRAVPHSETAYLVTTAVVANELVKLACCLVAGFFTADSLAAFFERCFADKTELLKMGFVSVLYVVQNNLMFIAVENLEAATFQVLSQLKILTTALMAVVLLSKHISQLQWAALAILTAGVAMVQYAPPTGGSGTAAVAGGSTMAISSEARGLVSVLAACCLSAYAGVYFEKQLKSSTASVWERNMQLGVWGVGFGLVAAFVCDGTAIMRGGFFQGYNWLVVCVVLVKAAGGLLVALVVKYSDNILKGFATSISIIISSFLSIYLFAFQPDIMWLGGTVLVMSASYLYSLPTTPSEPAPHLRDLGPDVADASAVAGRVVAPPRVEKV